MEDPAGYTTEPAAPRQVSLQECNAQLHAHLALAPEARRLWAAPRPPEPGDGGDGDYFLTTGDPPALHGPKEAGAWDRRVFPQAPAPEAIPHAAQPDTPAAPAKTQPQRKR